MPPQLVISLGGTSMVPLRMPSPHAVAGTEHQLDV
jgi:hypothetical protein